jgi:hypothetical protein
MAGLDPAISADWNEITGSSPVMTLFLMNITAR